MDDKYEFFWHTTEFHGFGKAKFAYGSSMLDSSQFTTLSKLALKITIDLKVVKIDTKIIISIC